jgi:hypothetical protein
MRISYSSVRKIRPLPKFTTALIAKVEAKERLFVKHPSTTETTAASQNTNYVATESPTEFLQAWKFGRPFYAPKFTNEQVREMMKQIVFRVYALDAPENQAFVDRWLEISLEDSSEGLAVSSSYIKKFSFLFVDFGGGNVLF